MNGPSEIEKRRVKKGAFTGRPRNHAIDLWDVLTALRRRLALILSVAVLTTFAAVYILSQLVPTYSAFSQILLGEQGLSDKNSFDLVEVQALSNSVIEGEIAILNSNEVLARVVQRLKLDEDSEFNPTLKEEPAPNHLLVFLKELKNTLMPAAEKTLPETGPTVSIEVLEASSANERSMGEISNVVSNIRRGLFIRQQGNSFILSVRMTSEDPQKAAAISNVLMDEYIGFLVDKRFIAARRFTSWLEGRVEELAIKLETSEREALAFRAAMEADADSSARLEQQMHEFTTKLVDARAELAEAQARADRAKEINETSGPLATASVLTNDAILEYRITLSKLRQEYTSTTRNFSAASGQVTSIQRAIDLVETSIAVEVETLLFQLQNRVDILTINVSALERSLRGFEGINLTRSNEQIRLNQLQRVADANRIVYEDFLGRYKETNEIQNLQSSDARVLSYASPPSAPAYPRKRVASVLSLFGGLLIGSALALVLEMRSKGFNNTLQVSEETGMSVFGSMQKPRKSTGTRAYLKTLARDPRSPTARAALALANNVSLHSGDSFRSIFVTSHEAYPDKTLTSVSLAWAFAQLGKTCILIDGDIRTAHLTKALKATEDAYFLPAVYGEMKLGDAIVRVAEGEFDFIGTQIIGADPSVIYNTTNTQSMITTLASHYEVVIIDAPSMTTAADSSSMSGGLDLGIFTIPAGKVSLRQIERSLEFIDEMDLGDTGVILTGIK
jgi:uncharacterized protein involved in exopolysaccharide biosynthesis/Mrp family chromosome partitioning ATPase